MHPLKIPLHLCPSRLPSSSTKLEPFVWCLHPCALLAHYLVWFFRHIQCLFMDCFLKRWPFYLFIYLFCSCLCCHNIFAKTLGLHCCHHDSVRRDKKTYYRQFLRFQVFWHSGLQIKRKKCPPGLENVALHIKSSSLAGSTEWQLFWNTSCLYSDSSLIRSG